MTPLRRTAAVLGSVGIAFLLVSCGVDAGDASTAGRSTSADDVTTTTSPTDPTATTEPDDLPPQMEALVDTMAKTYRDLGFTDEEATCLAEGMAGAMGGGGSPTGMSDIMDVINDCDIPLSRFTEIQGDLGGSPDDAMRNSMIAGLKNLGMSDDDASCVADGFADRYGPDIGAMQDPSKLQPILEDCGVDPLSLQPGG